ncbi:MAG: GTPase ObgE [Bacteroidia bacterium]
MSFIDYLKIHVRAGDGGDGVVHWRREKYVPRGGPDGGDGGDGGSIYLQADPHRWTLLELKYKKILKAPHGAPGKGKCKTGASGKDVILKVPLGTVVRDADTGQMLGELLEPYQRLCVAKGGKGGKGNHHFRHATLQAPDFATPGKKGQARTLLLELKLLADVGIVGFPNAGKSTLLSVLTDARPAIGDYPFTTLVPNLGVAQAAHGKSFVLADIPGLIEGAHQGKGLGLRFLRHVERNAILLFLIPTTSEDPTKEFRILRHELGSYDPALLDKPYMIAFSKGDLLPPEKHAKLYINDPAPQLVISSVTHYHIPELKDKLYQMLSSYRAIKSPQTWE